MNTTSKQVRNQGRGLVKSPLEIFRTPRKNVLDIVYNYWTWFKNFGTPQKTLYPPGVPSWLHACFEVLELLDLRAVYCHLQLALV